MNMLKKLLSLYKNSKEQKTELLAKEYLRAKRREYYQRNKDDIRQKCKEKRLRKKKARQYAKENYEKNKAKFRKIAEGKT